MSNLVPKKATLGHSCASRILYFALRRSKNCHHLRSEDCVEKEGNLETLCPRLASEATEICVRDQVL